MGIQTDTIDVATSIMVNGVEKFNASGDLTTNLIQGADNGTGVIVGHAPVGASTGSALQLVSLTTAERDNLVGADGMLIWNETTTQIERYDSGWAAITADAVGDLQGAYAGGNTIVTDSGNGAFDVSGTEAISLDAQAASNFTVTGSGLDLTLSAVGGGSGQMLVLSSAGTGSSAIDVNATAGGIDMDAAGLVDIQTTLAGTSAIRLITPNGGVQLTAQAANSSGVVGLSSSGTGANAIDIDCTSGGFDLDAGTGGVDIFSTGGFSIDSSNTTASNLTSANTTASTNTALTIACNNTGATAGDADLIIDASSTNGTATIAIGTTNADAVSVSRTGIATTINGSLTVTQAATFTAAADFDAGITVASAQAITGDGALTVAATSAVLSLDGTGIETSATTFTADAAFSILSGNSDNNLTLATGNNGAGDSGDILVDVGTASGTPGVIALGGTNATNVQLKAASAFITGITGATYGNGITVGDAYPATTGCLIYTGTGAGAKDGYGFVADDNSGMFLNAGTQVEFYYNGAQIYYINGNGINLGERRLDGWEHRVIDYTTASPSVPSQDTGAVLTNRGAAVTVSVTLPSAPSAGSQYWAFRVAAQTFRLVPGVSDAFITSGGVQTDGKYLEMGAVGSAVKIIANADGNWMVFIEQGTITIEP